MLVIGETVYRVGAGARRYMGTLLSVSVFFKSKTALKSKIN